MNSFLNRFNTPLTFGLFAISAVSGVALFFHVGQGIFHGMHEWLSMVLLIPFVLHSWKHWGAIVGYARRGVLWLPLAAVLIAAVAFAVPGMGHGERGSPFKAIHLMTQTRLADLAPVLKTTPEGLQAALAQRGYKVASNNDTLEAVAGASGVPPMKLLMEVIPAR